MTKVTYIPNRVIDADGISDGASFYVYQTGTTTKVNLFAEESLTTPIANPVLLAAGAAVPPIYTDEDGLLRVRIVASDGTVALDDDPYESFITQTAISGDTGAGLVGFKLDRANTILREAKSKLSDGRVSVADFIPKSIWNGMLSGTQADVVTYVNNAVATLEEGDTLYFPGSAKYLIGSTAGEMSITPLPEYTNVYMDPGAWIYLDTSDTTITAFVPSGNNILTVNVDGRSLAENETVDAGTWINNAHGVRAYGDNTFQIGAKNVTIINSKFRNLRYAIQTEGAITWHIIANRFERTQLSAILMGCSNGYDCLFNLIQNNLFENLGDYAAAFYEVGGNTTGQSAFNSIIGNMAATCQLRTNGHAFGWEFGDADLQHHNLIANNVYDRQRGDVTFNRGVAVINTNSYSVVTGNVALGSLVATNDDQGISCQESKYCTISNNTIRNYRGGGIHVDGSDNILIEGNTLVDCGGGPNSYSLMFSRSLGARAISVLNNRVSTTAGFVNVSYGMASIGGLSPAGKQIKDITIRGNDIDRPFDSGIYVAGDPSLKPTNILIDSNTLTAREEEDAPATHFELYPIGVRYSDSVQVTNNRIWNAKFGLFLRDNTTLTVKGNEFAGTQAMAFGMWCAGSGKIISDNNIVRVATTSMLNGDTPATLATASSSTVFFGMNDAFWPMTNSADNAAAIAAGNTVGMFYHTAGAVKKVI